MSPEYQKEQYIARQGVRCLYCGSYEIESGDINWDTPLTLQVSCLYCGRVWRDVLKVVGVVTDEDDNAGLVSVRKFAIYNSTLQELASPKVYNAYEGAALDPECDKPDCSVIAISIIEKDH